MNRFKLQAVLERKSALLYTPAGVPLVELGFAHQGTVVEASLERRLQFDIDAIALGDVARQLERQALGTVLMLEGFIAPRSQRSKRLVAHVTEFTADAGSSNQPAPKQDS